jgi:hypothetical protein
MVTLDPPQRDTGEKQESPFVAFKRKKRIYRKSEFFRAHYVTGGGRALQNVE